LLGWAALACSSPEGGNPAASPSGGSGGVSNAQGGSTGGVLGKSSTGGTFAPTGGTTGAGNAPAGGAPPALGGSSGSAAMGGVTSPMAGSSGSVAVAGGGSGGAPPGSGGAQASGAGAGGAPQIPTEKFSFFVTSLAAMRELSGNQDGFGGDLRFGEATGLEGADKICRTVAESSMPGAGNKTWRAFLSTIAGPVHAIDRVGAGPWYDRLGRLVARTRADLLHDRPMGADPAIIDDLPNEFGVPNHIDGAPDCTGNSCPDNHDVLTGTGPDGMLYSTKTASTCKDWTYKENVDPATLDPGSGGSGGGGAPATGGRFGGFMKANGPWCGHSWPREGSGVNWMSALAEGGCAPGINLDESMGPMGPEPGVWTVGTGGGYGAIYCFALEP
jgi:hypothetical protein